MPHWPGNIYGKHRNPIDQLKNTGKKERKGQTQKCICPNDAAASKEQSQVPIPSCALQEEKSSTPDSISPSNIPNPDPEDESYQEDV